MDTHYENPWTLHGAKRRFFFHEVRVSTMGWIPFSGQTTLGMFDRGCGAAHRLNDVADLANQFPSVFEDSGLKW